MIPRERQLAAIRHELTDRLSIDVICIDDVEPVAEYLGIPPDDVHDRLHIDGRKVAAAYTGALLTAPDGREFDEWQTDALNDYGTTHHYPLAGVTSVAEIERFAWPSPDDYDYSGTAEEARRLHQRYAVRGPYWRPLFCRVCSLVGMEEAMMLMATEPVLYEALLDRIFDVLHEYCRRLLDACGETMDILCLGDDFATQRGLMISPEHWRRFIKPRLARLFELGKLRGKPVWFHSCGDVTSVLGDLIDIGIDVWETVQLHTLPMSPEQLKCQFGKHLTFFGGINTQQLPFTTVEAVGAEVERVIRILGRDGGYICGPDHHIKPDVPPANTVALFDTAAAFHAPRYTR